MDVTNIPGGTGESHPGSNAGQPQVTPMPEDYGEGYGDGSRCRESVCQCISSSNVAIAQAIQSVSIAIQQKVEEPCKDIDKCIDKIIDAIKKKVEGPLYDCETCKQMIANGLGGTIEYAVRCAAVECDKCLEVCSSDDDGKCCKNCGEDKINCKCEKGVCVGEDKPEQKPKAKYIAWCNRILGTIQVTKQTDPPLVFPWEQVGLTETEQAAVDIATKNCTKLTVTKQSSPEGPPPTGQFPSPACDLNLYASRQGISSFAGNLDAATQIGGWAQIAENLGELGIGGLTVENIGSIAAGVIKALFSAPMKFSVEIVDGLTKLLNCNDPQFSQIVQVLMNAGMAQKFVGVDVSPFLTQYRYALNALCRQKFLTPDAAMGAFLANAISYQELDTQWAIEGLCPQALEWNIAATRAKPVPLQLAIMRHRQIITPQAYHEGMRQLGYLETSTSENLFALTYQVPTMTDIIRFMVRDADDDSIVSRFGLDDGFEQKYRSQLRQWSQDQGVPEIVAKYSWRSHWQIPSPTQLFEFNRRLRHNEKFGGQTKLQEDIKQALIQQDILPYWHDHYLAVSYLPMTRMDLRRAFAVGAIDKEQVESGMQQIGHNDETAKILTEYVVRLRDRGIAATQPVRLWRKYAINRAEVEKRLTADKVPADVIKTALDDIEQEFDKSIYAQSFAKGDINRQALIDNLAKIGVSQQGASKIADRVALRVRRHPALLGYAAGGLNRADADGEMAAFGMDKDVIRTLLDNIDADVKWSLLQRCQNGIKHRYLSGELDGGEAKALLINNGTTDKRAQDLIKEWNCEKSSIGKAIPTSTLCTLLEQGAITAEQFTTRLRNIGYTADDATLLTNNCLSAISDRRSKAIQAEIKRQQADQRKQQQALARAAAAAQREGEAVARAAKQAAATRQRREKQLLDAAEKIYKRCDCDIYTAIGVAKVQRQWLIEQGGLDIDTILAILIRAAENMETANLPDYATHVQGLYAQVIEAQPDINANGVGTVESQNG